MPSAAVSAAVGAAAAQDAPSVVSLAQRLVATPSRAGVDPYEPVLAVLASWLADRGLPSRRLENGSGRPVGLACDVPGASPGPRIVLDACVDTPPFGDPELWRHPPTSAVVEEGWLCGRGSADCKTAAAVFCHVAARISQQAKGLKGALTLLFDADEHTGGFGGARRYFGGSDAPADVAGVMIGYPGLDRIVIGGRGFLRAELVVHGTAGHTGASSIVDGNAVEKAAVLVEALARHRVPAPTDAAFGLAPKLTVTAVHGGEGYSIVPDRCTVNVDVRLTPSFDRDAAARLLEAVVAETDRSLPTAAATTIGYATSWPAFRLDDDVPIVVALRQAAARHLGQAPACQVAGPSNIGNYLASLGIPATAGFGVAYRNLHGTDECVEVATIPTKQAVYHEAVLALLS
jgi:succinyl-diaminopimelate desuccinylase